MAFWDGITNLLVDSNLPPVDIRNPNQQAAGNLLLNQYQSASANPNYGLPDPQTQTMMENELTRDILARTGTSGAGGSGYSGEEVRKGLVDFRVNMIAQRQRNLDALRSAMIMGQGPALATADRVGGILPGIVRNAAGTFGQRVGDSLANDTFGEDPNAQANNVAAAVPGGGFGTTGYRPNGGMSVRGT
jgi:hypothetical protein